MSDETLGFDAIRDAVTGEGHFLGGDHTLQAMERDYYYPSLANRDTPAVWDETGAPDAWSVARAKAREILAKQQPGYLDKKTEAHLKSRFKLYL